MSSSSTPRYSDGYTNTLLLIVVPFPISQVPFSKDIGETSMDSGREDQQMGEQEKVTLGDFSSDPVYAKVDNFYDDRDQRSLMIGEQEGDNVSRIVQLLVEDGSEEFESQP